MFSLNRKPIINPELSKYIKEKNLEMQNKLSQTYSINTNNKNIFGLVKQTNKQPDLPNYMFLLPLVSLMSFMAGYKFCKSIS